MRLSVFRTVVTPPFGHPLCGGWIAPAAEITDPQYAIGIVLTDEARQPAVLCAVDWCEIRGEDHLIWRRAIAEAVGTHPDRVAVQCVHPHNAPLTDLAAQRITRSYGLPDLFDEDWFRSCVKQVALFAGDSVHRAREVTHVTAGQARVEKVASNRRIHKVGGKVQAMRGSTCKNPELRAMKEGLIDPMLKTISFWNGGEKLASLHYYATHPMSYYGDGKVTSDFAGLARERLFAEQETPHIYFNGCGGNVAAGKYNDGSKPVRAVLANRIYQAMVASEERVTVKEPAEFQWRTQHTTLPPGPQLNEKELRAQIEDAELTEANRKGAALTLAYLQLVEAGTTIPITCLQLGDRIQIVHLPGEPFVEYQLYLQKQYPGRFIAVAGYGDGSTGYIPLAHSFEEGGYEVTAANVSPGAEMILKDTLRSLLS